MIPLKLFIVFLRTGFFAIGGAYSFLPLMEQELVQNHNWLSKSEFLEITGVVEMFPGAISIKFATYTGYKMAGIGGAIAANAGNLLPPVCLMILAFYLYSKYKDMPAIKAAFQMVRYAVFALIIAVAFKTIDHSQLLQIKFLCVIVVSFVLFVFVKIHPAFIIIGAAVLGGLINQLGPG